MRRGFAAAVGAVVVAASFSVLPASAEDPAVVLLAYDNDVDGPIAETAAAVSDQWAKTVSIVVDSRVEDLPWDMQGYYNHTVGFPVDCIIGVGDNAAHQAGLWAEVAAGRPWTGVAHGEDRYDTALQMRRALTECLAQ